MTEQENLKTLEKFVHGINNRDVAELLDLIGDDYVEEYPQSGERIIGKENFRKVYENFRNLPTVKAYNVECCGDLGIVEMLLDYPDGGVFNVCDIIKFRDGKLVHLKAYFGQPFDAADWRSEWVEMMGDTEKEVYKEAPRPRA